MIRAFISIEIPERIRYEIFYFVNGFSPSIKPVPPENIHITLEFLGEITNSEAELVANAIKGINAKIFGISIGAISMFSKSSNIAFVGINQGYKDLEKLHDQIHANIKNIVDLDSRPYVPHATVARGDNKALAELSSESQRANKSFGFSVDSIVLKKSFLASPHPKYETIFSQRLG